jgi:hypothetical protein
MNRASRAQCLCNLRSDIWGCRGTGSRRDGIFRGAGRSASRVSDFASDPDFRAGADICASAGEFVFGIRTGGDSHGSRSVREACRNRGTEAKVGLVAEGFFVVKAACLERRSTSPGCRAMKPFAIALLVGCAVFVPPYAVHAQGPNRLYPDLQPPTLHGSLPQLDPVPQPRVPPGSAKQPTPPPRQEPPTDGTGPRSPAAGLGSSPPEAESSEQAPAPVPSQPSPGFPWWPVICVVLVVMLVCQKKRRT